MSGLSMSGIVDVGVVDLGVVDIGVVDVGVVDVRIVDVRVVDVGIDHDTARQPPETGGPPTPATSDTSTKTCAFGSLEVT